MIVHTSGSTSEPKGVIHAHGALIRHLDNLNQLRRYDDRRGPVLELAVLLDRRVRLRAARHPGRGGDARLLERTDRGRRARPPRTRATDHGQRVRRRRWPMWPRTPRSRRAISPPSGAATCGRSCRADVRPTDPELPPRHARDDRGGQRMPGQRGRGRAARGTGAARSAGPCPDSRPGSSTPTTGATCAAGEVGELWFRGPFLMEGYLGPRAPRDVRPPTAGIHTGDLVTADDDGYVYFRGRSGDMIKTAGANVSPREVEAAILEVSGLGGARHRSRRHGAGPGRGRRSSCAPRRAASISSGCAGQLRQVLSAYKVPQRIVVIPDADGAHDVEREARPAARCGSMLGAA